MSALFRPNNGRLLGLVAATSLLLIRHGHGHLLASHPIFWRLRLFFRQRLLSLPPPSYCIASANHRKWLQPILTRYGWRAGVPATATLVWQLAKVLLPKDTPPVLNAVPNLLLLDDKAVLALLTRRFTRTRPLVTHVLYGEWDDARVGALRDKWADPNCSEPRWWIIKDAHASNGFSAALFDRNARSIVKKDVAGGYCYVVQEYVERPMLVDGRKFEMRQYVLIRGDGSAYTYDGALMRLACVDYDATSKDPRVHITNKYIQTGWEAQSAEGRTLDDIERLAHDWPMYKSLLTDQIVPIVADLADAVAPLIASGLQAAERAQQKGASSSKGANGSGGSGAVAAADRSRHFELFACDLVVSEEGKVDLMEVNINCALGAFHPRTINRLVNPLFEDLVKLCVLPAAFGGKAEAGRWIQVREAGLLGSDGKSCIKSDVASKELQEHQMYLAFKKSGKKKYERQFVEREFLLSDVQREETPKEEGKCLKCGYFACVCAKKEEHPVCLDAGAVERRQIAAQPNSNALTRI